MSRDYALIGLIVLAFALWYFAFQTEVWNFWVRLSLAAALLATIALILTPDRWELFRARPRDIAIGVASALLLYAIFWVGKQLALAILPFAADQIQSVYAKRGQLDLLSIGLLLFFLLGPSEEIFWRGFVQRRLGLPATTVLYALVHIWTLNLILIIAAGVAGLLWGWLYQREQNLIAVIVSHALWDVSIFVLFPLL
jgi:membrane protease YdiL (CAAX protease family)